MDGKQKANRANKGKHMQAATQVNYTPQQQLDTQGVEKGGPHLLRADIEGPCELLDGPLIRPLLSGAQVTPGQRPNHGEVPR